MLQAARPFPNLLLASAVVCACAQTTAPIAAPPVLGPGESTRLEDAAPPTYYGPTEVEGPPVLLTPIEPPYPPAMRARGREGEVVIRFLINADGSVAGTQLVDATDVAFTEAVSERIREARFAPAVRAGQHVPSWVLVRIRFRLG